MKYEVKFSRKLDELQSQVEVEISFTVSPGITVDTATVCLLLSQQGGGRYITRGGGYITRGGVHNKGGVYNN